MRKEFNNNLRYISETTYENLNIIPVKSIVMNESTIEKFSRNFANTFVSRKETQKQFYYIIESCLFSDIELYKIRKLAISEGIDESIALVKYAIYSMMSLLLRSSFKPKKTKEV
jgi:hypothetical protein